METKTCSIVVSVYNEEAVLRQFHKELSEALTLLPYKAEILYIDDGSHDDSRRILDEIASATPSVKVLHFSRNFGHEAAMIAGIDHAIGDAVVCMDADLQNPPACLESMLKLFEQGNDIITMVREDRADGGVAKHVSSRLFYRLINRLSEATLTVGASDFFLLSNRTAEVLRHSYRERTRFLRGFIQNMGFQTTSMHYHAPRRAAGKSHYGMARLTGLAFSSIASFSKVPLKLGIYSGLVFGVLCVALIIYSLVMWVVDRPVGGYTTLIIFLSAFASVLLLVVGIIGYYVGIILDEVKARPLYTVEYSVGYNDLH